MIKKTSVKIREVQEFVSQLHHIIKEKKFDFCKNLFTNFSYRFDFYI